MRYLIVTLLLLLATQVSAAELYTGHSMRGMSYQTDEEITGFLLGEGPIKFGGGVFGSTKYAHVIAQYDYRSVFAGIGAGAVSGHPHLDGSKQFTLTAGFYVGPFVVRWVHFSNGADLFQHGDKGARARNHGVDCLTLGVRF